MNMYRSGGDIHPGFIDILGKVYGSILFNDRPIPASFPGCWACEYGGTASLRLLPSPPLSVAAWRRT
jgi:hypothetical protein